MHCAVRHCETLRAHGAMRLCPPCIARIARRANLPQPRAIDLTPKSAAPPSRLPIDPGRRLAQPDRHAAEGDG